MYTRSDPRGNTYLFSEDRTDLSEFADHGDASAHSEDPRTVTKWDLDRGDGVAFGRGNTTNPDRAEAFIYFDAQDSGAAAINGTYKLVVLNAANEEVAVIDRGSLDEVRDGDPSTDSRGDWGKPLPYKALRGGKGEVLGGQGHKIGIQIETASGTATFSTANSTLIAEGYQGTLQN